MGNYTFVYLKKMGLTEVAHKEAIAVLNIIQ